MTVFFSRMVFCLVLAAGGAALLSSVVGAQALPAAYTAVQADRGKVVYEQSCSSCHGASLRGGANEFAAPALAGPFFLEKWGGRSVEELFRYAVDNMPPEQRLADAAAYVDVTAYILQVLKFPAGQAELTADSPLFKQAIPGPQ